MPEARAVAVAAGRCPGLPTDDGIGFAEMDNARHLPPAVEKNYQFLDFLTATRVSERVSD